jgi:hypothetical protein
MKALALLIALEAASIASEPKPGERLPAIALKDEHGGAVKLPVDRPTVIMFGSFS